MKRLLLAAAALAVLLAASHAVIAAGEREAVIRALETVAVELGRNGRVLRWGSIETGGGLFTTDVTVSQLSITQADSPLNIQIASLALTDVDVDREARLGEIDTVRATDLKLAGLFDPAASSLAGVDLATPGTRTEASASAGEIVLSGVNGTALFDTLRALSGNLDRVPAQYSLRWLTNLRAVDLSVTTESAVTVTVPGRPPKSVPSLSYSRAASITTRSLDRDGFIEIMVEGIDGKIAERPGRSAHQSFAIASLRAVVADFSAPAFVAEPDLIAKFFHPLIREIEVVDNVQSNQWMVVDSARDWGRHESGPGGTHRFVFGSDRTSWTPQAASLLRPMFEQQFGPEATVVSTLTGTLTYDSARREVGATGHLVYSQLMELGWDVAVRRIPRVTLIDLQTGAKDLAKQPMPILEKWSAAITDHGARRKALAAVGTFAKPKRSAAEVMVDFLAWIDSETRDVDRATEPLTAFALAAIKDFVRFGGTLRLTSDQPSSVSDALLPAHKALFDRQQILVEHTPPN